MTLGARLWVLGTQHRGRTADRSAQLVSTMRNGGVREVDPGGRGAVKLGAGQGWCVG